MVSSRLNKRTPPRNVGWSVNTSHPVTIDDSQRLEAPSLPDHELETPCCLSDQPHEPKDIKDHLKHYFGCLEITDRLWFLDLDIPDGPVTAANSKLKKNPIWVYEADVERKNLKANGIPPDAIERQVEEQLDKKISTLAVTIEAQYKRTDILRQALLEAPDPENPDTRGHLVRNVESSYDNWTKSAVCRDGLEKVREFRVQQGKALKVSGELRGPVTDALGVGEYKKTRQKIRAVVKKHGRTLEDKTAPYDLERDVNAYLIQYSDTGKNGALEPFEEEVADVRFKGRFPNQRVSMGELLGGGERKDTYKDNILSKHSVEITDPSRIRYFHIPSNNMHWVERAIAGYYDNPDYSPDLGGGNGDLGSRTQTGMLLRSHLWRGQQNGTRSNIIHARYMRPLCERVSSGVSMIEDNPANIVMFMPYMHWETDRMRAKISGMIDHESRKQHHKLEQDNLKRKNRRQDERKQLVSGANKIEHLDEHPNKRCVDRIDQQREKLAKKKGGIARSLTEVFSGFTTMRTEDEIEIDDNGRLKLKNENPLGQYLLDAARLYEAMSMFRDQQMLERYLYHKSPMHPRRTLDQSHYWTLKSTKARDRDQVVYRGTSIDMDNFHKIEQRNDGPRQEESRLTRWMGNVNLKPKPKPEAETETEPNCKYQWKGHWSRTDKHGCEHCKNDIKKVSQLIMVDQLWMWVLDDHTIITSFPKRYGYNKHDLSGVHKSIRQRLNSARKNQIRSVYDLALIILDECTNTFFDRTKTEDSQPQVMDIFSESIGNVTSQHTISFQHVWHWTKKASEMYRSKSKYVDSSKHHVPLLDIHPEGKLQREVKDIIDELDMMIYIHKKQRDMFRRFCKHVEHILDPEGRWREGGPVAGDSERQLPAQTATTRKDQLSWFRMQSQELLSEADDRVDELEGLRKAAASTAQSVNDLLSLKQQQASVVQAWESAKQAEEAVRQGRSIMMFTIVTVVFLPLSFMTSFFGMNNIEFGSDGTTWTMGSQTKLIVLVSFGIVLISVILAFSNILRALIWSGWKLTSTYIIVTLPIYRAWLSMRDDWQGMPMVAKTEEMINRMKEDVRRAKTLRRFDKATAKKDKEEKGKSSPEIPAPSLRGTPPTQPGTQNSPGASKLPGRSRSGRRHNQNGSSSRGNLSRNSLNTGLSMTTAVSHDPRITGTTIDNDNGTSSRDVLNGDDNNV